MTSPGERADSVTAAYEHIRAVAKRRGTRIPDAGRVTRGVVRGKPETGARVGRVGRPTGPDGRALRRPDTTESVGSVLGDEIRRRGWGRPMAGGWVKANWEMLVGEQIAQHSRVQMLKDKQLFISCDSTAWATNLRLMQRKILQVIAEKVGPDVVAELKIFGPTQPSWRKGPLHVKGRGPRDTYG
ncbi:DciA family protein [Corynebacterium pygosceleis]|uniref:DciA family protein n=1 Tax=Corynebacterium pygosceleis TaxID=2800406 RepID=A0A9Q4GLK4_9CORY|nr:DciA family protein [Corynebacterium pygosceleis]MCK7637217.1 DciA family protein [Corynebacterium pygosceleis]MCK7676154.1 DciA family protein [Corynebacterium pygosceleis]MCL0120008.1 DciA family protein [Corynebacterium pygosceleis]MCX7445120.1 DciA family protein [Corynebacterium pygosceleis]MCX7468455.1 DciA family protein [Corynebacterium pygosceleis]